MNKIDLSLIVPCFNEEKTIGEVIRQLKEVLAPTTRAFEILVIDDGSGDRTAEIVRNLADDTVRMISHESNLGYGAAIKSGLNCSRYAWVGIVDTDFTYPIEAFPALIAHTLDHDMVIGSRTGKIRKIPLLRRPAKWFINRLASFIARRKIPDVNSGMRLFRKETAMAYFHLFPDGFSLTTTLTLSFLKNRFKVKFVPIDYFKRKGKSKIRPLADTYQFVLLVFRLAMLFDPLRVFMPVFFAFSGLTFLSLLRDLYLLNLTDSTVILFVFSIQILMMGLLADLINRRKS